MSGAENCVVVSLRTSLAGLILCAGILIRDCIVTDHTQTSLSPTLPAHQEQSDLTGPAAHCADLRPYNSLGDSRHLIFFKYSVGPNPVSGV